MGIRHSCGRRGPAYLAVRPASQVCSGRRADPSMRVLYLSPYPPARDGIGNYTSLLARAVSDAGHEIALIIPRDMPYAPPEVIGCARRSRHGRTDLAAAVERWNPDVIHVQFAVAAYGTRTLWLLRWLSRFRQTRGIPVVVTLHEVTRESAMLPVAGRVLFRQIARHCDHLIVHTDVAFNTLISSFGVRETQVSVIPHPTTLPPPPAPDVTPGELRQRFGLGDARVLLAFGFIHVDKGLDDLVRALGVIRRTSQASLANIRLVVAGAVRPRRGAFRLFELRDHLHFARVLQLVRRNGLADLVVRTGYVPAGDVAAWFQLADAVVLPYRRTEQSGVANLASSFNVAVVASRVGGLAEMFTDSPWTFPARSPDQLAETIMTFLAAQPGSVTAARSSARADDLASVTASTLAVYRQVIRSIA
jgi:glycosyltransferase involved in cell wall biosynthesis